MRSDFLVVRRRRHPSQVICETRSESHYGPEIGITKAKAIFNPVSSTLNYFRVDWNPYETYIDINLYVNIYLQTKLDKTTVFANFMHHLQYRRYGLRVVSRSTNVKVFSLHIIQICISYRAVLDDVCPSC